MPLATKERDDVVRKVKHPDTPKFEVYATNGRQVSVFEDSPRHRLIVFRSWGGRNKTAYRVKTPWVYFMVVRGRDGTTYMRACIFFSETQLEDEDQRGLGLAPLPNVFNNKSYKSQGGICFGRGDFSRLPPKELIERFWGSCFTGEITQENGVVPESIEAFGWNTLRRWAALTRRGIDLKGIRPIYEGGKMASVNQVVNIISHD